MKGIGSLHGSKYSFPASPQNILIGSVHLLGSHVTGDSANAGTQAGDRNATNWPLSLSIMAEHCHQSGSHGKIGIDCPDDAAGNSHCWRSDDQGKSGAHRFDNHGTPDRELATVFVGNGSHQSPLNFSIVKIVDGLVEASSHVSKAVRGCHDRVATQVEKISFDDLDLIMFIEGDGKCAGDVRID